MLSQMGTLQINKQIFQTEHKLLRIPTGGRQRGRVVEFGTQIVVGWKI